MNRSGLGRKLIGTAAILTIVIPIAVDGIFLATAPMANPLWLPHAKLHCAMSFFAAISLGVGTLAVLKNHPILDPCRCFPCSLPSDIILDRFSPFRVTTGNVLRFSQRSQLDEH